MSEPIRESIPTSFSKRSERPTKRRALTPVSQQSAQVEALFAHPERAEQGIAIGPKPRLPAAPPEIVANVQGSSAGAGSGEFHVYKASRRREYERLRVMDEEVQREEAEAEFREKKEERERLDEERLEKNRAKRRKAKERNKRKELGDGKAETPPATAKEDGDGKGDQGGFVKRKLAPARAALGDAGQDVADGSLNGGSTGDAVVEAENTGLTIHDDD